MNILEVRNLSVVLKAGKQKKTLVDDVSFQVAPGECVGVLGESGSGKSMTSKAVLGLLDRNFKVSGQAVFEGQDLLKKGREEMRRPRTAYRHGAAESHDLLRPALPGGKPDGRDF